MLKVRGPSIRHPQTSTNSVEVTNIKGCNVCELLGELEDQFKTDEETSVCMVKDATPSTSNDLSSSKVPIDTALTKTLT